MTSYDDLIKLYRVEHPLDWVPPASVTSWGVYLQTDPDLLKKFGAERLACTHPNITSQPSYHLLYGLYKGGWNSLLHLYVQTLPGCCGVALFSNMQLTGFASGLFEKPKEMIDTLVPKYEAWSKNLGYTVMMATELQPELQPGNYDWAGAEHKAYTKAGWKPLQEFKNRRSGNQVTILTKEL
jgi:hypothetical protein